MAEALSHSYSSLSRRGASELNQPNYQNPLTQRIDQRENDVKNSWCPKFLSMKLAMAPLLSLFRCCPRGPQGMCRCRYQWKWMWFTGRSIWLNEYQRQWPLAIYLFFGKFKKVLFTWVPKLILLAFGIYMLHIYIVHGSYQSPKRVITQDLVAAFHFHDNVRKRIIGASIGFICGIALLMALSEVYASRKRFPPKKEPNVKCKCCCGTRTDDEPSHLLRNSEGEGDIDKLKSKMDALKEKRCCSSPWVLIPFSEWGQTMDALLLNGLWDKDLDYNSRNSIFKVFSSAASRGQCCCTRIKGINSLALMMESMNRWDNKVVLDECCDEDDPTERQRLQDSLERNQENKNSMLTTLDHISHPSGSHNSGSCLIRQYARYRFSSIHYPAGCCKFLLQTLAIVASLCGILLSVYGIYSTSVAVYCFHRCPDRQGFTYHGYANWASDYTPQCLRGQMEIFNTIPGEPSKHITEQLHNYHFKNGQFNLDLSFKWIDGDKIGKILEKFADLGIEIPHLDVSGNYLYTSDRMAAFVQGLNRTKGLRTLRIAGTYPGYQDEKGRLRIGGWDEGSIIEFTRALSMHPSLTSLDLSGNRVFNSIDRDSKVSHNLFESIGNLINLVSLNVSNNDQYEPGAGGQICISHNEELSWISNLVNLKYLNLGTSQVPIKAVELSNLQNLRRLRWVCAKSPEIGDSISRLHNLRTLSLEGTQFIHGNRTASALAEGIARLKQLETLDLSGPLDNLDSYIGVISEGLKELKQLKNLHLRRIKLGAHRNDVESFAKAIGVLHNLKFLDIAFNDIGKEDVMDDRGTVALARELGDLSLDYLDMRYNNISFEASCREFYINSRDNSPSTLLLFPQDAPNSVGIQMLNHIYPIERRWLLNESDVEDFFGALSPDADSVNLAGRIYPNTPIWGSIFKFATSFPITSLNLSNSDIDSNPNYAKEVGDGLKKMGKLEALDLSHNSICCHDDDEKHAEGTVALAGGIGQLNQTLLKLDLSVNCIGQVGAESGDRRLGGEVIGNNLKKLTQLKHLDIFSNKIKAGDFKRNFVYRALFDGLHALERLEHLDASGNDIGDYESEDTGTANLFGDAIGNMPHLRTLILRANSIGTASKVNRQFNLNFGENLGRLTKLMSLDLSENQLGLVTSPGDEDTDGVESIAKSLSNLINLSTLVVARNYIGSSGTEITTAFLSSISKLHEGLKFLDFADMTNFTWVDKTYGGIIDFYVKQLKPECDKNLCFSQNVSGPTLPTDRSLYTLENVNQPGKYQPPRICTATIGHLF